MHIHEVTRFAIRALLMACHGFILLAASRVLARELPASETRMVIVEGVGTDIESARKDAYRAAVRQVLGTLVDSETLVENDSIITDKVVTFSDGFVERVEPLPGGETREGGLVRVRFKAFVRSGKMVESLLRANELLPASQRIKVADADSVLARVVTLQERKIGARDLFLAAAKGYPANCFQAEVFPLTDQNVRVYGDNVQCYVRIKITARQKEYEEFAKRLITYLESLPPEGQCDRALRPSEVRMDDHLIDSVVATVSVAQRLKMAIDKQGNNPLATFGVRFIEKAPDQEGFLQLRECVQKAKAFRERTGRDPVMICVVPKSAVPAPTCMNFFVEPNKCESLKDIWKRMSRVRCALSFRRGALAIASESTEFRGLGFWHEPFEGAHSSLVGRPNELFSFSPWLTMPQRWLPLLEFTTTVTVPIADFKKDLEVECTLANGEAQAEPGSPPAK